MLHGRDAERSVIAALLDGVRASRSGVLVVRGRAGAGKSALLEDAVEGAADMQVLRACGIESEAELAFAALHQLLRPDLHRVDGLPPPQEQALRAAFGLEQGVGEDRFLVSVAVLSLLAEAAEKGPVLCVVDDAHWLDEASANALVFVARRLEAERVALLFAARDGDIRRFNASGLPELEIGGLDRAAVGDLLAERAGVTVDQEVRHQLVEQTGGNALALTELPSVLTPGQLSGKEPLPLPLPLTQGVERAFLERVRRLPGDAQTFLLVAAAEDTGRLATVVAAAAKLGAGTAALDAAERAGLVRVRALELDFRHPLVRSAIYQAATTTERQQAHRALAGVLNGEADVDRRAWHGALAAVEPDEAVVRELEETARRARARGGLEAACAAFERAAELTAAQEPRGRDMPVGVAVTAGRVISTIGPMPAMSGYGQGDDTCAVQKVRIGHPPQGPPSGADRADCSLLSRPRCAGRRNTPLGERASARRLVNGSAEVEFPRLQLKHDWLASLLDGLMPRGRPARADDSRAERSRTAYGMSASAGSRCGCHQRQGH
jgi:predicted ATPase